MQHTIEEVNDFTKKLSFDIMPDQYAEVVNEVVRDASVNGRIKGFRPGKAPRNVLIKHFSKYVNDALFRRVINPCMAELLEKLELSPSSNPILEEFSFKDGEPLHCVVTFEALPKFDCPDVDNMELTSFIPTVTDDMIDAQIEVARNNLANITDAEPDHEIAMGDCLDIQYLAYNKGEAVPGKDNLARQRVELGTDNLLKELETALIGRKVGDAFSVDAVRPETKEEVTIDAEILSVNLKILPEVNDDMVKDLDFPGVSTLDELRTHISGLLLEHQKNVIQNHLDSQIVDNLSKAVNVQFPKSVVDMEIDRLITNFRDDVQRRHQQEASLSLDGWLKDENLRSEFEDRAKKGLTVWSVVDKLVKKWDIVVSDEEVEKDLDKILARYGIDPSQTPEAEMARITKNIKNMRRNDLINRKVYDRISSTAKITFVESNRSLQYGLDAESETTLQPDLAGEPTILHVDSPSQVVNDSAEEATPSSPPDQEPTE
ncbi:MAG: trigger factor [Deltaproteobacteria bacterium]|nr:trigger factor [Deltaproteobacteria bacterium]